MTRRSGLLPLLVLPLALAAPARAAAPETASWLGLTEVQIQERLGPPRQVERQKTGKLLVYDGAFQWLVDAHERDMISGAKRGPERTKKIGSSTITYREGRPDDEHLPPLEDPDHPGGSASPPLWVPGQGGVKTDRLRISLDETGRVFKVRLGRKTIEERAPAGRPAD